MKQPISIFWFRRDLRIEDNAGLFHALKSEYPTLPIFIFDTEILSKLPSKQDRRVDFIHQAILGINSQLSKSDSGVEVHIGKPSEIFKSLFEKYDIKEIFTNKDYEKYGIKRDEEIAEFAKRHGAKFHSFKDQTIFEKKEVLSGAGTPYTVFTPYSRKWKEKLNDFYVKSYPTEKYFKNLFCFKSEIPSLERVGFEKTDLVFDKPDYNLKIIENYTEKRDFPAVNGTTKLSIHLRFGTLSIREAVKVAMQHNGTWLNELIWRDFYMNILANFPQIGENKSFRPEYDNIKWRNNESEFEKWCTGNTGFPIVDAGMRELNETGFMHNRVRMIVASFLCKDLLIDWRWGEAYFAQKLNDYDFSANNGGWQWASGSGCDAAPYFRVFNPDAQALKFDKELKYIKKWIPELNSFSYPKPMVDHKMARERALKVYKEGLTKI